MVKKEQLQKLFDKITQKLHQDEIGNIDVAYIDYEEPAPEESNIKPVFVAFHDRDFLEYFKLAFMSELFEVKPTINNPLADPTLAGMEVYQTVKSYYLQWRKQQLAGGSWASQSKAARTYAREDAKQTASLAKLAALEDAFDKSFGKTNTEANKSKLKNLGTPRHTSAPWEDPLKQQTYTDNLYREEIYKREQLIKKAIKLLETKKHFKFFYTNTTGDYEVSSGKIHINCRISLSNEFPFLPMSSKIVNLNFDIPERMFNPARHQFDDSVHIPLQEAKLTDGHLILRIAYIIHQAAKLKEKERITNEVIYINTIRHTVNPTDSFESLTFAF